MSNVNEYSNKSRAVTALLCFLLGIIGIHRFYVGKVGTGILMIIFTLSFIGLFISAIWALIDLVLIIVGSFKDKEGKYIVYWDDVRTRG